MMTNTHYKAKQNGDWGDAGTWDGAMPGNTVPLGSVVTIPDNITVTVPARVTVAITNGHMYLNGNLNVQGTLALTINGPRDPQSRDYFDSLIDMGLQHSASLTIAAGGSMIIVSEGFASVTQYLPVYAINIIGASTLSNAGSIEMTCTTHVGSAAISRGYGIKLDIYATLDNSGSIGIASYSPAGDGYGPAFGIKCSGMLRNNSGATITSTAPPTGDMSGGTVDIEQKGQFINAGTFINAGQFQNDGSSSNSGTITQMYPWASYSGASTVAGAGIIRIQGILTRPLSLDQAMPGQSNFTLALGQSLTVNASFTIPANYMLDCQGSIVNNSFFTNNGTLRWNLDSARYSGGNSILGTGRLEIYGKLPTPGEFDLNKFSQSIVIRGSTVVTIPAGAVLLAPRGTTLTIEAGCSLITEPGTTSINPGIFWFGGTVQNNGNITNNGALKYQYPSGTLSGGVNGNGLIALQGYLNAPLDLASLPWSNFVIMAGDTLELSGQTLTTPATKSLTVYNGPTPGFLSHSGAKIIIAGTLSNQGTIGNNGGSAANGTIVHSLPTASYSGNPPDMIVEIQLQGAAPGDVSLSTLGYGTAIPFGIASTGPGATVNGTLTLLAGCTLVCSGALSAGAVRNDGTFVYNFDSASLNVQQYEGPGSVCLNGLIRETQTYAQVTAPFFGGPQIYQVRAGDELAFLYDTDLPAGHRLKVFGDFAVTFATLTLNTPPDPPDSQTISATLELMPGVGFSNNGTIVLRNTKSVGLWFHNISLGTRPRFPLNSGLIDASVDQQSFCSNGNCAVLIEGTSVNNTSGTINSGPTGRPTIYCNNGVVCGGTLDGPVPPGSGMQPNPGTTYSPSC